jgi:short-subunit dehydrogenase
MMDAGRVARLSVRAMLKRQPVVVTGKRNSLALAFMRLLPERLAIWLTSTLMMFGSQ